jgi:hypothetical protein
MTEPLTQIPFAVAVRQVIQEIVDAVDEVVKDGMDIEEFLKFLKDLTVAALAIETTYSQIPAHRRKRHILVAIRVAVRTVKLNIPGIPFLDVMVLNIFLLDVLPLLYDILSSDHLTLEQG